MRAAPAPLLKIKLDREAIVDKVAAIRRAAPDATLIVDANEAWSGLALPPLFAALLPYRVVMLEQPLPAGEDAALQHIAHPIPLCTDESCHTRRDIAALRDRYEMINIKLDKCGGLTEALAMEVALPVALQAEHVDLDGPIWLAADSSPFLFCSQG
ncbi:L-Ala-D/L-Glu epimerase|nr:L-Ala-D/L-Glu epimerase [Candidatus Pantoea persica]